MGWQERDMSECRRGQKNKEKDGGRKVSSKKREDRKKETEMGKKVGNI